VEFVVKHVKLGGNGPLMSDAFGRLGGLVRYVGCVGWPNVNPLFDVLSQYGPVTTIAPAALTLATEFEDGKIMHGKHESLREVTWENLVERLGGLEKLDEYLSEADLVALVNWTMLPFLTEIFRGIQERVEKLGEKAPRMYFFDLCDPEKRTTESLVEALRVIGSFASKGRTAVLGLNEKESIEVCEALGIEAGASNHEGIINRARNIARNTAISEVVIHPRESAAAWGAAGEGATDGPVCSHPRLTTGAGDHFNGGYMYARIMGLPPEEAVLIGVCVSGYYVRAGHGPSVEGIGELVARWEAGTLDPWDEK
jgi:sugar/nucleoside kinase (ribokinase family)